MHSCDARAQVPDWPNLSTTDGLGSRSSSRVTRLHFRWQPFRRVFPLGLQSFPATSSGLQSRTYGVLRRIPWFPSRVRGLTSGPPISRSSGFQRGPSNQTPCLTVSHIQLPGATGREALFVAGGKKRRSRWKEGGKKNIPSVAFEGRRDSFKI